MQDNYAVLGLTATADLDEVKKAYRRIVKTCHPDRFPNDPVLAEKFLNTTKAYDHICDSYKVKAPPQPKPPTPQPLYETRGKTQITLRENYTGARRRLQDVILQIPPGVLEGDVCTYTVKTPDDTHITVSLMPSPLYTIIDRIDLAAEIKLSRQQVRNRRPFPLKDFPNPHIPQIVIPIDTQDKEVVIFENMGLMDSQNGCLGDLHLKVNFYTRQELLSMWWSKWKNSLTCASLVLLVIGRFQGVI